MAPKKKTNFGVSPAVTRETVVTVVTIILTAINHIYRNIKFV